DLDERLCHQAIGQQELVLGLESEMRAAARPDIGRGLDVEPERRKPLHPERGPCLRGSGADVLPDPHDDLPPPRDGPAVEQVRLGADEAIASELTLGPEPEAVDVAADPALRVPTGARVSAAGLPLELIEQQQVMHRLVVQAVTVD